MAKSINKGGMVYVVSSDMANSGNMELANNKQPNHKTDSFYRRGFIDRVFNTFTSYILKKMPEVKLGWVLAHLLGIPCVLLSILPPKWLALIDINMTAIKEPYQSVIWILCILYLVSVTARSWEKWHHMHLRNKEHRHDIKKKYANEKIH